MCFEIEQRPKPRQRKAWKLVNPNRTSVMCWHQTKHYRRGTIVAIDPSETVSSEPGCLSQAGIYVYLNKRAALRYQRARRRVNRLYKLITVRIHPDDFIARGHHAAWLWLNEYEQLAIRMRVATYRKVEVLT